jgi:gliding motility-associated-like protein
MLRRILLAIVFFVVMLGDAYAQLEAKNWLFGTRCGLTFEKDSIIIKNNIGIRFGTGVSVISDKEGNLLFYSNGEHIWNKNHDTLKNGDNIFGSKGTPQSALFIPMPENPNLYYVFSVRDSTQTAPLINPGFWYHIIDKTKDNGNGEVILKNQFICGNVVPFMSATLHADRKSVWIVVQEKNSNKYKSYILTNNGLDMVPVISEVGTHNNTWNLINILGNIKFSPSGDKIAKSLFFQSIVDICDFNKLNGKVSNCISINLQYYPNSNLNMNTNLIDLEFSPNEEYLYVTIQNPDKLKQIDISSNVDSIVQRSVLEISNPGNVLFQGIQMGLDKKVYLTRSKPFFDNYLNCIERPNQRGDSCHFNINSIEFDKRVGRYLPNFLQSYFYFPDIEIENICLNDSTAFSLADTANIDSVLWKFGDGDSMMELFPKHVYADTGTYNVQAILFFDNQNDTFSRELRISNYAYANFSIQDTFQCLHGNEFRFYDSSHAIDGSMTYKWDFGDSTFLFSQTPKKIYANADTFPVTLTITSSYGCETSVTKNVYVQPLPELDIQINDSVQCLNENSFSFSNNADSFNYIISKKWYFGDGDSSFADTAFHSYDNFDSFRITLIEETIFGCRDTAYKDVVVNPSPQANFSFNDSVQCFNEQMLEAGNSSLVAHDSIAENKWILNSDSVFSKDLTNYVFSNPGIYPIQLVVSTKNNCRDTLVKDYVLYPSPKAGFVFNDSTQCFNEQFLATRNSSLVVGDSITENLWYLSQDTLFTEDIVGYKFNNFGTYPVKLVVSTSNDCKDSITKNVEVYEAPIADFSINDSSQCFNENNFKLTNQSQFSDLSKLNHWWDLGDMTIVNNTDVTHSYSYVDTFTITLETQTPKGCKDKLSKQVVVLPSPKAVFSLNDSVQCFNEQLLLAQNSSLVVGDSIAKYQWLLDSQFLNPDSYRDSSSPVLPVIQPGTSELSLIATTFNNCPDTATHSIIIHPSPLTNFAVNDSTQCLKSNSFDFINLSTIQSGTMDYQWFTNNQNFQSFNLSTFNYPQWGKYPVSLTATSNQNCKDSLTKYIYIYPNPVSAFVYLNKCLEDTMYFYDSSYVDSGMIAQWYWNFGDTNRSTMKDPTNIYQTPGQYGVILTTTTDQGCTDDSTRFFKIHPHVSPNEIVRATVENDETILLEWLPPDEGKPETYTLEKSEDGMSWFELSTFNEDEFSYEDYSVWVDDRPYWYRMNVTDSCQHTSDYSNIGKSIFLKVDNTQLSPQLTWTAYHEWAKGIETYELQIQKDGEFHNLQSFNFSTFNYIDSTTKINETEYCYRIVAYQSNSDVVSVSNVVCIPTEFHIFAPNSFTPNGDGTNDIFKAIGTYILDYQLIIYDRWGTKLFETTDITQGWDGTYKNQPCPMDAYYFYINAQGTGSQRESIKGTIMLLR